MTGARALAEMLDGYGVTHVFMVPAVLRRTLAELERFGVRRIHTHGEKPAAYMADGYARMSGRPGVCMAQAVGALNLAAGLRDAHLANSPVIALTGGRDPAATGKGVYQEVDDLPAFVNVTRFSAEIDAVEKIPDLVRQAFRSAVSARPGPAHLQFVGNEGQIDLGEGDLDPSVEPRFVSVPPERPLPDPRDVAAALDLLERAERPVLVAGGGGRTSRAARELVGVAERLAIPVVTSLNGKDTIPGNHPLCVGVVGTYSRSAANRVVNQADLVCFVGSSAGSMTTHFWQVPVPGVPAIQIDIDPEMVGRNYPLRVAIRSDARTALTAILEGAGPTPASRGEWLATVRGEVAAWRQQHLGRLRSDAAPIRPERLCAELTDLVPDDACVVVDTGHAGMWMGGMFDTRTPDQRYLRSAGHLGWAFPAALGAKCAAPARPVVCFTGDAGLWYHIAEIETAVRWGINTVTVVNNNSSGNQSARGFDRAYGGEQTPEGRRLWTFNHVDFARLAEGMGAMGIRVEKPGEIGPSLERALAAERPVVIDVVTDVEAMAPLAVV
ncbi:MAG: thiamine pyrophosphate-binding protein [Acidimicrobiia bacterium]|nr:thiamine pyrophosphate-binding protein [Acidimicrobiia bacterium]MYC84013.1 thiamine pyrophosphate-binding protein [Acidimicrobiia bacterium]